MTIKRPESPFMQFVTVVGGNGVVGEQGLLADRPAAAALPVGSTYFAVDTGALTYTNGTTWEPVP